MPKPSRSPAQPVSPVKNAPLVTSWAVHPVAGVGVALCAMLGYMSRLALNPDGVSYLDLAAAFQHADWAHFVQGYWSPLFPALTGLIGTITGANGPDLISMSHALNSIAATGAILLLWVWGRRAFGQRPGFGILAITAFMLCSAGMPRIEAVTPDVMLLTVAAAISYEILFHDGRRWLLLGALLGASFLLKTSAWPWLLAGLPIRWWLARDAAGRRNVIKSSGIAFAVMLLWIVPLSLKEGTPTLGSSGRLNFSWYIEASTARLPDGDHDDNRAYQQVNIGNGTVVTVATFADAAHWTYQPWGNPTAWAAGVIPRGQRKPTLFELFGYWGRTAARTFGLWLLPLILATIAPALLLYRRADSWRGVRTAAPNALTLFLLGLIGVLQFVAVHAEPRLIAPYGLMLALAAIWFGLEAPEHSTVRWARPVQRAFLWVGVVTAIVFAFPKFGESIVSNARLAETTDRLAELRERLAKVGNPPIAIVGPAIPVLSAAYWAGVHIAMQIPPASLPALAQLTPEARANTLRAIFKGKVPLVWQTTNDGALQMLIVPAN